MTTTVRIYPVLQAFEKNLTQIVFVINQLARGLSDLVPLIFNASDTTSGSQHFTNNIKITDNTDRTDAGNSVAFNIEENVDANTWGGNKFALRVAANQLIAPSRVPAGLGVAFTGFLGTCYTDAGQGGTLGNEKGGYFGGSNSVFFDNGTSFVFSAVGQENNIQTAPTGVTYKYGMGYSSVAMNATAGSAWDAAYEIGGGVGTFGGTPVGFSHGILATDIHFNRPFKNTATFVGALFPTLGTQTMATGIDMRTNLAFTGNAFQSLNFQVEGTGKVTSLVASGAPAFVSAGGSFTADGDGFVTTAGLFASQVINTGRMSTSSPRTITGAGATSASLTSTDYSIIGNVTGVLTLTLPGVTGSNNGRWLYIKTITANTVVSASANVVPRNAGSASVGTAILAAAAGNWAALQSDGTNWVAMAGS